MTKSPKPSLKEKTKETQTRDLPLQTRQATLQPNTLDVDERTVELVWSVGAAVRRRDPWTGDAYDEVLSLDTQHVDLSRLNSGAPLLNSHGQWNLDDVIGVVERAWIEDVGDHQEGKAVVRFSKRPAVDAIWHDVVNGIVRNVSVGYSIRSIEVIDSKESQVPVWRAVDWQPMELSAVPIGADASAGFRSGETTSTCQFHGLSKVIDDQPSPESNTSSQTNSLKTNQRSSSMPSTTQAETNTPVIDPVDDQTETRSEEATQSETLTEPMTKPMTKNTDPMPKQALPKESDRVGFWEGVLQGAVAEALFSGQHNVAEDLLKKALQQADKHTSNGEVYLLGAGPGDPDLLTLRAFRLLQQADVVLHDALVSDQIMALVPDSAERIYVGKRRANHSVPQGGINQLLVDHAKLGKRVARLKGGDPFIFGRGGEEIETLATSGVPFQVVPGITAASGCSAYAGIPLTHRDYAQSVRFVTGQLRDGSIALDWQALAVEHQTLVFYMGLKGLPIICQELIRHGMDPNMPAALVEKGTTQDQRVIVSDLSNIPEVMTKQTVMSPSLFIVGRVVDLHDKLAWFDSERDG